MWKSDGVSFKKAIRDIKSKFTLINNYISLDNINCFFLKMNIIQKI